MYIFTRPELEKISRSIVKDGKLIPRDENNRFTKFSEGTNYIINEMRNYKRMENCEDCKKGKYVCSYHYHDYQLCNEPYCVSCVLFKSFGLDYHDNIDMLEDESKVLIKICQTKLGLIVGKANE